MTGDVAQQFRELADNAPVMIWRSGLDKRCDFFNQPWLAFTGRTLEQELGFGWTEGVHPDDFERCLQIYVEAFEARRAFSMEYRLRRADGEYRWMFDNGRPFYREGDVFAGYFGSCVDVTEQRALTDRLTEALQSSQRLLAEKEVLLAEVHHRVRNILQRIMSMLHLAQRDVPDGTRIFAGVEHSFKAMALAHAALYDGPSASRVGLRTYLCHLGRELAVDGVRVDVEIEEGGVPLTLDQASALGAVIAESILQWRSTQAGEAVPVRIVWNPPHLGLIAPGIGMPRQSQRVVEANAKQAGARMERSPDRIEIALG